MRLVPLQRASLVVIFVDAVVIVSGFVTGSALLPRSANVVLMVISLALMSSTVVFARGGYNFENPTLPAWSVVVAVIAFFGGALLFAVPLLADTIPTMVVNQRGWAGLALAFAGGTFVYAGIRHRK
jgi:hypothetical protein